MYNVHVCVHVYGIIMFYSACTCKCQQVDNLRKKRERLITEVASIRSVRQREPDLQGMKGQKAGVQSRLRYAERELGHLVSSGSGGVVQHILYASL